MKPAKQIVARWGGAIGAFYLANYLLPYSPESGSMADMPVTWLALKGALTFGGLGLLQGLILKAHVPVKPMVFAALGAAAGGLSMLATSAYYRFVGGGELPLAATYALSGAMTGALLGGLQLIAMPGLLRNPLSWPATAALAWGVGRGVESACISFAYASMGIENFVVMVGAAGTIACMIIGGISGIAAVKLIQGAENDPARRVDETGQEHHR